MNRTSLLRHSMTPSRHVTFIVPGSIETRTGGYEYDRRVVAELRTRGWSVDIHEIDASFPHPTTVALAEAAHALARIADGGLVLIDGLAGGAMPDEVEREAGRLRIAALVHMPLAVNAGIDPETADRLDASERRALRAASLAIVTGRRTVDWVKSYGVAPDRVALVEPGTVRAPAARGSGSSETVQLLSVATVNAGKGHEDLVRALAMIPERNWRLTCAGSLSRATETVARVRHLLAVTGLDDHVALAGELEASPLEACYDAADVFVLATLYETYGMAVAEAIARGLPVIATTTGEIPGIVEDAGLLVEPGDLEALSAALSSVIRDSSVRERLRTHAMLRRERLRTWDRAGEEMSAALERMMHG